MSKPTKTERAGNRMQQLERELSNERKKNKELQQQKTIRLNDQQAEYILGELKNSFECQTERIIHEIQEKKITVNVHTGSRARKDWFSATLRIVLSVIFIIIGVAISLGLVQIWSSFWENGWAEKISLFVVATSAIVCILIGIDIYREKDRNYITSLFATLVALVALIVTLVK